MSINLLKSLAFGALVLVGVIGALAGAFIPNAGVPIAGVATAGFVLALVLAFSGSLVAASCFALATAVAGVALASITVIVAITSIDSFAGAGMALAFVIVGAVAGIAIHFVAGTIAFVNDVIDDYYAARTG